MLTVSIIGAGLIGQGVIDMIEAGAVPGVTLGAVLVRKLAGDGRAGKAYTNDWDPFIASRPDIIIELAGPAALRQYGLQALAVAETWSISGAALADATFAEALDAREGSHPLRLLSGAVGGLEAIKAGCVDPHAHISMIAALASTQLTQPPDFIGSAREVLQRYHGMNVVAAVALASVGLDRLPVRYYDRRETDRQRRFIVEMTSRYGSFKLEFCPTPTPGPSAVTASVISALRDVSRPLVVG